MEEIQARVDLILKDTNFRTMPEKKIRRNKDLKIPEKYKEDEMTL